MLSASPVSHRHPRWIIASWRDTACPISRSLAGGGQDGVAHMLRLIEAEMRVAMALTGRTSIGAIDRSALVA